MGNWHVSIKGTGTHHNGLAEDVEQLAKEFLDKLKAAGHSVTSADVHVGALVQVPEGVMPLKPKP